MTKSCIYEGRIRHRRFGSPSHSFDLPLYMMYLDLAELPALFEELPFTAYERSAVLSFRRADHFGPPEVALDRAVRQLVKEREGLRLDGPIGLLTHVRCFGHVFNPISLYFCFESDGARCAALVAEVESTPWHEKHLYVLAGAGPRYRCAKALHVSPFLDMNLEYAFRVRGPGRSLVVHIDALQRGEKQFDATLRLQRRELGPTALARMLFTYPLLTVRIVGSIYLHAAALWLKGARFFPHP